VAFRVISPWRFGDGHGKLARRESLVRAEHSVHLLLFLLATLAASSVRADDPRPPQEIPAAAVSFKQQGDKLAAEGRYDEALAAYRRAIQAAPAYHLAFEGLGQVFFARGMYGAAIEQFRKALELSPAYILGHYNIGYALRKAGRYREAIEAYEEYRKRRPDDPDTQYGLAESYKALGDAAKAVHHFERYVQLEKRPGEAAWVETARREIAKLREKAAAQADQERARVEAERKAAREREAQAEALRREEEARRLEVARRAEEARRAEQTRLFEEEAKRRAAIEERKRLDAEAAAQRAAVEREARRHPAEASPAAAARTQMARPTTAASPAPSLGHAPSGPPPPPPTKDPPPPAGPDGGGDRLAARFLREGDEAFGRARYAEALLAYRKASWRLPQSPSPFYKLGLAYLMLSNYAKAAQAFEYVLTLDPKHAAARASLEATQRMLRQ
jgi:tetratricopeptide (TPR) repeat protein